MSAKRIQLGLHCYVGYIANVIAVTCPNFLRWIDNSFNLVKACWLLGIIGRSSCLVCIILSLSCHSHGGKHPSLSYYLQSLKLALVSETIQKATGLLLSQQFLRNCWLMVYSRKWRRPTLEYSEDIVPPSSVAQLSPLPLQRYITLLSNPNMVVYTKFAFGWGDNW